MDINSILSGVKCDACGRMHDCTIKYVYIEKDACRHLSDLCKDYNRILIVADENTFNASGKQVENALCGIEYNKVIFSGKSVVIPDENAIERV